MRSRRRDAGGLSWGKAESLKQNGLVLGERGLGATFLRLAIVLLIRYVPDTVWSASSDLLHGVAVGKWRWKR